MSTNMELIEAKTSTSSSVTFSSIPQTYTDLQLVISSRTTNASSREQMFINPNGSTTNNNRIVLFGYDNTTPASGAGTDRLVGWQNGGGSTSNTFSNISIYFPNYTSSNNKSFSTDAVAENNSSSSWIVNFGASLWSDSAAITSIEIACETHSFASGSTFYLYGISNVTSTTKATGGIVSSDGTYNYHMFPFSGTFTPTQSITADYLVIAGGGAGGVGGGGAGGYRTSIGGSPLSLTATSYSVTVGAGGAAGSPPTSGSDSVFSTITSTGGGRGSTGVTVFSGGSGGGGGNDATDFGLGNTPSTSPSQGNNGGQRANGQTSGGGGGTGGVGGNATATSPTNTGGAGGIGSNSASTWATVTQTGVNGYYAGGGGGGGAGGGTFGTSGGGLGGLGGGGNGELNGVTGRPAIINTGSGGGGGYHTNSNGNGGSGLVIIRYAI